MFLQRAPASVRRRESAPSGQPRDPHRTRVRRSPRRRGVPRAPRRAEPDRAQAGCGPATSRSARTGCGLCGRNVRGTAPDPGAGAAADGRLRRGRGASPPPVWMPKSRAAPRALNYSPVCSTVSPCALSLRVIAGRTLLRATLNAAQPGADRIRDLGRGLPHGVDVHYARTFCCSRGCSQRVAFTATRVLDRPDRCGRSFAQPRRAAKALGGRGPPQSLRPAPAAVPLQKPNRRTVVLRPPRRRRQTSSQRPAVVGAARTSCGSR
jgi:hypothetical protein